MSRNFEINGPAFIKMGAKNALDELEKGNIDFVRHTLINMHHVAEQMVSWLISLAQSGKVEIPDELTWTKHIHRNDDEEKPNE